VVLVDTAKGISLYHDVNFAVDWSVKYLKPATHIHFYWQVNIKNPISMILNGY